MVIELPVAYELESVFTDNGSADCAFTAPVKPKDRMAVSYTHLTLPTILRV